MTRKHGTAVALSLRVLVRIGCTVCQRAGECRLARLAERCGAEATLEASLYDLIRDCRCRNMPHRPSRLKDRGDWQAYFSDLHSPPRPPDMPPGMRRPVLVYDRGAFKAEPPMRRSRRNPPAE